MICSVFFFVIGAKGKIETGIKLARKYGNVTFKTSKYIRLLLSKKTLGRTM